MKDLSETMDRMKLGEKERMQHLENIFGQVAAPGMLAVMEAVKNGDIAKYEEALKKENVTGTSHEMALAKNDNLAGDLTALGFAWGFGGFAAWKIGATVTGLGKTALSLISLGSKVASAQAAATALEAGTAIAGGALASGAATTTGTTAATTAASGGLLSTLGTVLKLCLDK